MLQKYLIFLLLILETSFAQSYNNVTYPYGGVPRQEMPYFQNKLPPLDFFDEIKYDNAIFLDSAKFSNSQFFKSAEFIFTIFTKYSDFEETKFYNNCTFNNCFLLEKANFSNAAFNKAVDFKNVSFYDKAEFFKVQFLSNANYQNSKFFNKANFRGANFKLKADFSNVIFYNILDLRDAIISNDFTIGFRRTEFRDTVFIGNSSSKELQKYDFRWSRFCDKGIIDIPSDKSLNIQRKIVKYSGTTLILCGPIDLKIQRDKFKHIYLDKHLDYYSKEHIISCLKDISFNGDKFKKERFMLDYLFEKSTMYQKKSDKANDRASGLKILGYWLYDKTMNLGYKPFKLIWFIVAIFVLSTATYFILMRSEVDQFIKSKIAENSKKRPNIKPNYFVSCLFFSALNFILFFKIKLMAQVLTYFVGTKKRFIIFAQWFLALIIYALFLFLHKPGSIGQGIVDLFVP